MKDDLKFEDLKIQIISLEAAKEIALGSSNINTTLKCTDKDLVIEYLEFIKENCHEGLINLLGEGYERDT